MKTKIELTDLKNLDLTIAKSLYPLLKAFKKHNYGYPGVLNDAKEWGKILDKMIESFRLISKCDGDYTSLSEMQKKKNA